MLVVACSARKLAGEGPLPAIDRYDGPAYRLIRKAMREGRCPASLRLLILSARYGLIEADHPTEDYDLKMTAARALEIRPEVSARLDARLRDHCFNSVFINLGHDYLAAIEGAAGLRETGGRVVYAAGAIGVRLARMKRWIEEVDPACD